jgi:hypothetical protein
MLRRGASVFLVMLLGVAASPSGNTVVTKAKSKPQDQLIMPERQVDDGNPNTGEFSGGYWTGGQRIGLDAYSVSSDPYYVPTADGGWEERVDYLYADSDMSKSDGSPLSYSVRELDRYNNQDMLYITLDGVTLPFDLNAGEAGPVSDADIALLNDWLAGQEGHLVEDTGIALVQQGSQQMGRDEWLNYCFVAMLVDTEPPAEAASRVLEKGGRAFRVARASFTPAALPPPVTASTNTCRPAFNYFSLVGSGSSLKPVAANLAVQGCPGCCGPSCYCITDKFGRPIWGGPCATHDQCTRTNRSRVARQCLGSFALSVLFVIAHWI